MLKLRMEQRDRGRGPRYAGEKATAFEPSVVEGGFMIHVRHLQHPWLVIIEPCSSTRDEPYQCSSPSRSLT